MSAIIIDDDVQIVELLQELLDFYKIKILGVAYDGKQGSELYSATRPDVVLLDLMMPVYGGLYGFEAIRKENPNAKIIIITGNTEVDQLSKIFDTNVAVFGKPFSADALISKIVSMINN